MAAFRRLVDFVQEDIIIEMIIDKLEARAVSRAICDNQRFEALGRGSSYKIPGIVDLTVNEYDGTAITPEDAGTDSETIVLNQFPFINFYLEDSDVNEASALSVAGRYAEEAATRIALDMDKKVFARIAAGATAGGAGLTGQAITTATLALDYLEKFAISLRESNVESNGAITVPSFMGIMLARELGQVNNDAISGQLATGIIATGLFGYDIYTSNNLPLTTGTYSVVGGKRSTYHLIEGTTIVKAGDSETKPATFNQFGQVWGSGFSNSAGYIVGTVTK